MEEFWQQGDEDRKLGKPVDLMYDRELAHEMPVGQIGIVYKSDLSTHFTYCEHVMWFNVLGNKGI